MWGRGVIICTAHRHPQTHTHTNSDFNSCWRGDVHPVAFVSTKCVSLCVCVGGLMGEPHLFLSALITSQADMKDCEAGDTAERWQEVWRGSATANTSERGEENAQRKTMGQRVKRVPTWYLNLDNNSHCVLPLSGVRRATNGTCAKVMQMWPNMSTCVHIPTFNWMCFSSEC